MSKGSNGSDQQGRKSGARKRPIFYIGPGILLALVLAAIVGGRAVRTEMARRQAASGPPIIERQVISGELDRAGPAPEVKFLIERRGILGLSPNQVQSLRKLQISWEKLYYPKMKEADDSARRLNDYLSRASGSKRTPVAQIQEQAAPVIALSREISSARRLYWSRAMGLLTPQQRRVALKEREADYARRKSP